MIQELRYKNEHVLEELKKILDSAGITIRHGTKWPKASLLVMRAVSKAWRVSTTTAPKIVQATVTITGTVEVIHTCNPGTGLDRATFPLQALVTPPQPR